MSAHRQRPTAHAHRGYELFSRGARDWLRHNRKLAEAVRAALPDLIAGPDLISRPDGRSVRVPVRFLEHYRFRLREQENQSGVGQGPAQPGDTLHGPAPDAGRGGGEGGEGGEGGGGLQFVLEFEIEQLVDWIWEQLQLPDLRPIGRGQLDERDAVREGWDRRGPRGRLDRRRTLREALRRRGAQGEEAIAFSDENLRYRQLAERRRPGTEAAVLFALDVSASMSEDRRKLAKSFFFWALQGLRRRYGRVATVFLAHTSEAWEISEAEFFQASASGGTVASSVFVLARQIVAERFDPGRYNLYLFYASDGDNFADDRRRSYQCLVDLASQANFIGFVETPQNPLESGRTETGRLFKALEAREYPVASYTVHEREQIWDAIRAFFQHQARQGA